MRIRPWLLIGSSLIIVFLWQRSASDPSASCTFTALDVGQGDALLIQTSDHQDMLIDGGPSSGVVQTLEKFLPAGDRDLELLVLTHPDADHSIGAVAVLNALPVRSVLTTGIVTTTKIYQAWIEALKIHQIDIHNVVAGDHFQLGRFLSLEVIWPQKSWQGKTYNEKVVPGGGINDTSVGLRLTCAGSTAIMIGDASSAVEDALLRSGQNLQASLYKVSHHGSKYSSTHEFLRAIHPSVAIISVGAKNGYGHPTPVTLKRLENLNIPVYRTDRLRSVQLTTDRNGEWRLVDKTH